MESAQLGIVLDSSILIAGERRGHSVREILEYVANKCGDTEFGISVVTISELVHGAYRAQTPVQQKRRLEFVRRLALDVPVYPMTIDIARLAGRIQGEQKARGVQFTFEDLVIGATALSLGYGVMTLNARDFQRIPGLKIVQP